MFFNKLFKRDKEKFIIPKGVQDVIAIKRIWKDGIFLVGIINIQRLSNLQI